MVEYKLVECDFNNFDELSYLECNRDVKKAVMEGSISSAEEHFRLFGYKERRKIIPSILFQRIREARLRKLELIRDSIKWDLHPIIDDYNHKLDFLSDELKLKFAIKTTENVSRNRYDYIAMNMINSNSEGIVLDCGAGFRDVYYENVLNFEIVDYYSTDVVGVGEELPFADNTFDAIISIAVLEHVRDPFRCAAEISRVLKPGGTLYSCIPFLQPYHGYPSHFFNATHQGHASLYERFLRVREVRVIESVKPIFTLTWFLNRYLGGLSGSARRRFLNSKIRDLIGNPVDYLNLDFVKNLDENVEIEIASATILLAEKVME